MNDEKWILYNNPKKIMQMNEFNRSYWLRNGISNPYQKSFTGYLRGCEKCNIL